MKKLIESISFLLILISFSLGATVISWIPPYNTKDAVSNLSIDYDGYGPKDGISHIALQFWEPDGDGGIRYVSKDGYSLEYMNDSEVGKIRDWGNQYGIKTMLCLYNGVYGWDWGLAVSAFNTYQSKTVTALLAKIDALDLGGVELDLEATGTASSTDKNAYIQFTKVLGDSLRARGKDLTVASFSYEWNAPNWDWWNELAPNVTAITSMGYESIGSKNSDWSGYSSQKAQINDPSKLMLGVPDNYPSWGNPSQTLDQHLTWIKDAGAVGVGLWDMELRSTAIKTKSAWLLLNQIRGPLTKQYKISSSTNLGGTIDPSGQIGVDSATNQIFTITPDQYFIIDYVEVDGKNEGNISSYEFTNVLKEHTINVYFKEDPQAPKLSTITTTANSNGTISPNGATVKANGTTYSFTVMANSGYAVDYVKIDGVKRGPIISGDIKNILSDHNIESFYKTAAGGDLGKYDAWVAGQYEAGDLVTYDGRIWEAKWSIQPTEGYPGITDAGYTSGWKDIGAYNDQPDSLITATLDYRSAADGSDTLIIKTDTVVSGSKTGSNTDTTVLNPTSIKSITSVAKGKSAILISQKGDYFIAPKIGSYSLKLFDLKGRIVAQSSMFVSSIGTVSTGLKVSSLSRGIYLMSISNGSQKQIKRIKF